MKKISLFLLSFFAFATIANAQIFKKKEKEKVDAITGTLVLHPDSVAIKGNDNKVYYFFLDTKNECLFITDNKDIFSSFSKFLPKEKIPGREIEIEGTSISPFTLFSKSQLKEQGKKMGLQLNRYKIYKIFNYGLKEVGNNENMPIKTESKNWN